MARLFKFFGGVHPPQSKTESTQLPIAAPPLPPLLHVPLHQHIGNHARPCVQAGERVLKGQMIGTPEGRISVGVHAPTSGTVRAIAPRVVPHPSGLSDLCVEIEPDGAEQWIAREPMAWREAESEAVLARLRALGIAGLGGAVFPTYAKLSAAGKTLDTLVINGAECEPFITCDDLLMRERAAEIVAGAEIMARVLPAKRIMIGIEDNKPLAVAAMQEAARGTEIPVEVVAVPTIYPGGGAKQLIRVLTGIEVPSGQRSTELGVQCFNVATAQTLWRALEKGEAMISRIVTVAGNVREARNYEVLLGTPIRHLLAAAGENSGSTGYIMGGPMMGFDLATTAVPVVKATNCIIAKNAALFPPPPPALPCIRCTRCVDACPAELQPQELHWFAKSKNYGKAQEYSLFDCIECGACAYVCPSHIPLVSYFRFAKSEIWTREREKKAADDARDRHEFRNERIDREKKERAERLAAKTAAAATEEAPAPALPSADAKEAAAAEAIARAQREKAQLAAAETIAAQRALIQEIAAPKHEEKQG